MQPIRLKTWITWALILFGLGLLADYFFLHLLFQQKQNSLNSATASLGNSSSQTISPPTVAPSDNAVDTEEIPPTSSGVDTFIASLKKCAPEIAAQTIGTPEALIEYLQKSVGIEKKEVSLENYHLSLPDGTKRRVHVVTADNTNSPDKKEIRFFKLDMEGLPERVPLKGHETLKSLLALGTVTHQEVRSQLNLKDGSSLSLEMHDNKVFEFQFNNHGQILSCRFKDCVCP